MTRRYRYIATAVAAAFLCASQPVWAGMVLCIGVDGHIAYEAAPDGDSCQAEISPVRPPALTFALVSGTDHCGDCRDIVLAQQTPVRGARRSAHPLGHAPHARLTSTRAGFASVQCTWSDIAGVDVGHDPAGVLLAAIVIQR